MSDPEERPDLDAGLCADRWRDLDDPWGGMPFDPWDKAEEPGSSGFAEWIREEREPTCLDCVWCDPLPDEANSVLEKAIGYRMGVCLHADKLHDGRRWPRCEYVTDESTVEQLDNWDCFGRE